MTDFTVVPYVGTRPHREENVEPASSVVLLNLGFTPDQHPLPSSATYMDRHLELNRLTSDPVEALLQEFAEWLHVTGDAEPSPAVALVQVLDLQYSGTVAEPISRRQAAILAQLIRSDAQLRQQHAIPSAPVGAQR